MLRKYQNKGPRRGGVAQREERPSHTTKGDDMMMLYWYPDKGVQNLVQVGENWDTEFRRKYGTAGAFLFADAYPVPEAVVMPDMGDLDPGDMEYKAKAKAYYSLHSKREETVIA
jgi:hypothetical protein